MELAAYSARFCTVRGSRRLTWWMRRRHFLQKSSFWGTRKSWKLSTRTLSTQLPHVSRWHTAHFLDELMRPEALAWHTSHLPVVMNGRTVCLPACTSAVAMTACAAGMACSMRSQSSADFMSATHSATLPPASLLPRIYTLTPPLLLRLYR